MFQKNNVKAQKLLIVDTDVLDSEILLADLQSDFRTIRLSRETDPVLQISQALFSHQPVREIVLLAHANPGKIHFTDYVLDLIELDSRKDELRDWRNWVTDDARLSIYACQLASNETGRAFIQELGNLTGITIAASSQPVGNLGTSQNWNLDRFTQPFEVPVPFSKHSLAEYPHQLAPVLSVTDAVVVEANSTFSPNMQFVVTLSSPAEQDVLVDYQTVGGTATEDVDFNQTRGTLTIAAGATSGVISITTYGGTEVEADEFFVLELSNPRGAAFADGALSLRAAGTMLDNDGGGNKLALFVDDVRIVEGDAGQREAVFLVRLSRDPGESVALAFTTTDGSAVAGQDYVATSGTLVFTAGGALVQEVRVPVLGDQVVEGSESFSLTVTPTSAIANGAAGASGMATILDDDAGSGALPVLSLAAAEVLEANSTFSPSMEFVVTLSAPATQDVIIDYQTVSGSAKEDVDFDQTRQTGQLVIAAGQSSGVIVITTYGGTEVEADEAFVLELSNPRGAVFAGDAVRLQASGVILDNDGSGNKLALFVSDALVVEGDTGQREAVFEVRLSRPAEEPITLSYVTRDGSARAGSDYQQTVGTLTFLAGETVKAVAVTVFGDGVVEGTEQFSLVVTPTSAIANGAAGAAGVATILDDDAGSGALPVLSLAAAEVLEANSTFSPSMEFVVTLSAPATQDVIVDYQTLNGSAKEGVDFDQTRQAGQLVIAAGQSSGVIVITTYGGTEVEADEAFVLELSNPRGAVFAGDALRLQAPGVILDNDGSGNKLALFVSDALVVEGDTGQREAVFEVRLSRPVDEVVTVKYTTAPGTASSGVDFAPVSGTLTFLAGQTVAAVHVPVFGDGAVEASETFSLVLSAPQGALFGAGGAGAEGVATILDDDAGSSGTPVISIADGEVLEANSTFSPNMEFVVTLSAPSSEIVRVNYSTVDGSAVAGSDYQATSGTLTFAPGQTSAVIVVTTLGGTVEEQDEFFTLRLSSPQNAVLAGGVAQLDGIGTILDNDGPAPIDGLPILSVADIQVQEQAGGSTAVFTLVLSSPSAVDVSGQFAVQAGTATAGADFTPVAGSFTLAPGQTAFTVAVPILDDALIEPVETFMLRLSEISNARFAGKDTELRAIGEIVDDDVTPGVAVAVGGDLEVAEGQVFVRTVNFTDGVDAGANGWTYEIDWDGDGVADETGSLAPGSSSFDISHVYPDGPTTAVVGVKVIDEAGVDEANASFTVTVSNVAPTLALTGADSIDEGSAYLLNFGTLVDPGADTATAYTLDWGDGTVQILTAAEFAALGGNAGHVYADDGNYTVNLTVTDEDGSFVAGSKFVSVNNVVPALSIAGVDDIDEGGIYVLAITATDPAGAADPLTYSIDWGDGSSLQSLTAAELAALGGNVEHIYVDDEDGPVNATPRTITVTANDGDGGVTQQSRSVTVHNVAPTLAVSGAASQVQGTAYALTLGAVTDPGIDTVTSYIVNWGDGNISSYDSAGEVSHTYASAGDFVITVDLIDEDGTHTEVATQALAVTAPTPTLSFEAGADVTLDEGTTFTRTIVFSDGEDNGAIGWGYTIDYGDGTIDTGTTLVQSLELSHLYADGDATHTVTVTLTDEAGEAVSDNFTVQVDNVAPTLALTGADSVDEGSSYTLELGAITDPGQDSVTQYQINWGDGSIETFSATEIAIQAARTHIYQDGGMGGTDYTIFVTLMDEDGTHTNVGNKVVTVNNVAPTLSIAGADDINEGGIYVLAITATDPAGAADPLTYSIDWGDGSSLQSLTAAELAALGGNVEHIYVDDEDGPVNATPRTITVTANDGDGGVTQQSRSVTVHNVAPTLAVSGAASQVQGTAYALTLGAVTDPGIDTVTSYIVNWGDGNISSYDSAGEVSHTYASAGDFVITVDLIDEDGTHTEVATQALAVTAPTPTLSFEAGADVTLDEGTTFTRTIVFSDGEDNGAIGWGYTIDYGDGTIDTGTTLVQSLELSHLYADGDATHTVTVTLTDEAGEAVSDNFTVQVDDVAPVIALSGLPEVDAGVNYILNLGAITDPGDDTVISYIVNWGDGSSNTYDAAGEVTHTFAAEGNYTISVDLVDEDDTHTAAGTLAVAVNPVIIPDGVSVNAGTDAVIDEGSFFTRTITFADGEDTGADGWTYSVDWGNDSIIETGSIAAGANSFDISRFFADGDASHDISVMVTDVAGDSDTQQFRLDVNNVAPTIALSGLPEVDAGVSYILNLGAITDPGDDTVTSYIVNWGDDSSDIYDVAGEVTHTFAAQGNYTISVDLVDEDGTHADAGNFAVTVNEVAPVEVVRIGDAPLLVLRSNPNAWQDAWTDEIISISHKSDYTNAGESWSSAVLNGVNPSALAGGDIFGGDLGVSGQSLKSSSIAQEIDGTEALRFDLAKAATGVTVDLSRLEGNTEMNQFDAGRLQLLDDSGLVVNELVFSANTAGHEQQITLEHSAGFSSVVLTAGIYEDGQFIFGGLADASGAYQSSPVNPGNGSWDGSDYLVSAIEFEFGNISLVGVQGGLGLIV